MPAEEQRRLVPTGIEQVRQQDEEPPAARRCQVPPHRQPQMRFAGGLEPFQKLEKVDGAGAAPETVEAGGGRRSERGDPHPVEVREPDVPDGRGQLGGQQELRRTAGGHRPAGVDHEGDVQVFLFGEHLDEEAIETGDHIPVDVPVVIAELVRAVVVELQAAPAGQAAPVAALGAAEPFPAQEAEGLELLEELRGQETPPRLGTRTRGRRHR